MAKYVQRMAQEKMENQWQETCFRMKKIDNECVQRHDVGREFLAFRQQQRKVGVLCEPHYRRVAGPGHGAQAGVVVVDEDLQ